MAAFDARRLSARVLRRWLWAAMLAASAATPAFAAESVVIHLDQARILKLPDRASTVVIGNPLIADLSVQPGGVAVVTGKGFGRTNMVAMDRTGAVLLERTIQVQPPQESIVVVYRGVEQNTYSCTPICEPRLMLGDVPAFFNETLNEISTRNALAVGAGASGAGH
jgi:hypothetical protein